MIEPAKKQVISTITRKQLPVQVKCSKTIAKRLLTKLKLVAIISKAKYKNFSKKLKKVAKRANCVQTLAK